MYVPKTITCLREGYGFATLRADALAGLTVAVVALPLAMAFAIASGATPDRGLVTAIVAGFLISLLGGSRHQIGGPTGAFVVVVFGIVQAHGFDGLVIATLMAGLMLIGFGLAGLGTIIKYVPYPVITGFTAGIAVIIFSTQVKEFLGLTFARPPANFIETWREIGSHITSLAPATVAVSLVTLAVILIIRRWRPGWPVMLIGVGFGAALAALLGLNGLPVETIGSRFGGLPDRLPVPALQVVTPARIVELMPAAFTIAFLAGIESLLSAVIADGMTGRRHRSNGELVAQGIANCASALFGGIPATGAIARTATNIRAGAKTPLSGMLHAVFLLLFMYLLAPLAGIIPLAALAAVLVVVAWNMSEIGHFRRLLRAPPGDRVVLVLTFLLTVFVDITVAIGVGVVLASLLFMQRMAGATKVQGSPDAAMAETQLPGGAVMFRIDGPFFFGSAQRLNDVLDNIGAAPKAFILGMDEVPLIDASGAHALEDFIGKCRARGTKVILVGVSPEVRGVLDGMGIVAELGPQGLATDAEQAFAAARLQPEVQ
jgi:SulP family sulfate permease